MRQRHVLLTAQHLERLAEQLLTDGRQDARQRRRLEDACAERVRDEHASRAPRLHEARNAERRVGAQLEWIAVVVVQAAQNRVDLPKTGDRLEEDAIVAHGEIGAFDQRESQILRQIRLLEIRLVVRSWRQQRDMRPSLIARRVRREHLTERVEERRQTLHLHVAKGIREHAGNRRAILERVAGARRRLRARVDDAPAAGRIAREIERDEMQKRAARRLDAVARAQIARILKDERRRQYALVQQPLRAIDVGDERVQQTRPLTQSAIEPAPLGAVDDKRQHVERPWPVGTAFGGVDVVRHAVLVHLASDARLRAREMPRAQIGMRGERLPPAARHAVRIEQFVEMSGGDEV